MIRATRRLTLQSETVRILACQDLQRAHGAVVGGGGSVTEDTGSGGGGGQPTANPSYCTYPTTTLTGRPPYTEGPTCIPWSMMPPCY